MATRTRTYDPIHAPDSPLCELLSGLRARWRTAQLDSGLDRDAFRTRVMGLANALPDDNPRALTAMAEVVAADAGCRIRLR